MKGLILDTPIRLGDVGVDSITGFTGTVTAILICLNGCIRCEIIPKMKKGEKKLPESQWIDQEQLVVKKKKVIKKKVIKKKKATGGHAFRNDPPSRNKL